MDGLLTYHTGGLYDDEEGLQGEFPSLAVPGRASDPSRSRDGDDGGYRLFRGFLIGYLGFSSQGQYIGGRRGRGGAGSGHTTPWYGPPGQPLTCLLRLYIPPDAKTLNNQASSHEKFHGASTTKGEIRGTESLYAGTLLGRGSAPGAISIDLHRHLHHRC